MILCAILYFSVGCWKYGLVQNYCNSFTNAKELQKFCTKRSILLFSVLFWVVSQFSYASLIFMIAEPKKGLCFSHIIFGVPRKKQHYLKRHFIFLKSAIILTFWTLEKIHTLLFLGYSFFVSVSQKQKKYNPFTILKNMKILSKEQSHFWIVSKSL